MPVASLNDAHLRKGLVYTNAIGLPRPITGSFASVYRMSCGETDYALRLFLKNICDQEDRYSLISQFVQNDDLPYTVTFDFLKMGIKIRNEWMPALKMQWVEGIPFDDYIVENLSDTAKLEHLLAEFVKMMQELRRAGIAHGDLQHGNIIMCGNELRLVDYDGMYVPKMKGFAANELGHRNYQHPQRSEHHFGPYLDNFSAWVIYASLKALLIDSRLFHQLGGGDDCLLFRQTDFADPIQSAAFAALENHENSDLKSLGRYVRSLLQLDPAKIPYLQLPLPALETAQLKPLSSAASSIRSGPRLVRGTLPEWMQDDNLTVLFKDEKPSTHQTTSSAGEPKTINSVLNEHKLSWVVPSTQTSAATWVKPSSAHSTHGVHSAHGTAVSSSQPSQATPAWVANSNTTGTLPLELTTPIPRHVRFDPRAGKLNPLLNKHSCGLYGLALVTLIMGYRTFVLDDELAHHGVDVQSTVTSVLRNDRKSSVDVNLDYKVNGKLYRTSFNQGPDYGRYEIGDHYKLHVTPSDPDTREPFGSPPGTRQMQDWFFFLAAFLITVLTQAIIWLPALKDWKLARGGVPVVARIDDLKINYAGHAKFDHTVSLTYQCANHRFTRTITVEPSIYLSLNKGSSEIILCDEAKPEEFILYRTSRYHPTLKSAAALAPPTVTQLPTNPAWYSAAPPKKPHP